MATTAERIREAMQLRHMKQVDIVEKTKISKGALSSYISGSYEPKQENIYKLAEALNVNEAWLMGHDVSMQRNNDIDIERENLLYNLSTFIKECPKETLKALSKFCISKRQELNMTEKSVAELSSINLEEYLSFEHQQKNIGVSAISKCLTTLFNDDLNKIVFFLLGYILGLLQPEDIRTLIQKLKISEEIRMLIMVISDLDTKTVSELSRILKQSQNEVDSNLLNVLNTATSPKEKE